MNLTEQQKAALRAVQAQEGRKWKAALRGMWERAYYPGLGDHAATLQQLRNSSAFGPAGLVKVRPGDLEEGMTPQRAMRQVTAAMLADGYSSAYEINNGGCEEWANEVAALLANTTRPEDHAVETWETVFGYADTSHVFLCIDGKFYDAECPEGVDDFTKLPLFSKLPNPNQPVWMIDHNGRTVSARPSPRTD